MEMKNNYLLVQEIEQQESNNRQSVLLCLNEKHNRKAKIINPGNNKDLKEGDVVLKNMGKGTMVKLDNVEHELIHITRSYCYFNRR